MKKTRWAFPITFEGEHFYKIKEFDCRIVSLYTTTKNKKNQQGTYFTVIPISSLKYRKENPTKAKVEILEGQIICEFRIWDDWGRLYIMRIPYKYKKEIDIAKKAAIEQELLKESICLY